MKNRVKAGLGLVGLGAISVGGVAAADPSLLGIGRDSMPPWLALSKDNGFATVESSQDNKQNVNEPYKGKFGEIYQNYFVGVVGPTKDGNNVNKDFWEWAFERLKKETTVSDNFKYSEKEDEAKVFRAVSNDNGKGLNQVCKKAYGATKENVASSVESDANKYKEEDVWKFCSPIGQKPTTIQQYDGDNYYGQEKIGGTHKSQLISVRDPKNYWFWEIRDWEIKGNNKVTCWKIDEDSSDGTYFYSQRNSKHIKDLCASAYNASKDANQGPKENETKKYCSLLFNGATSTKSN